MIGVLLREGEPVESALKRFKRECVNAGIQSEAKKREFFEKPSRTNKRKVDAAIRKKEKKRLLTLKKEKHL